MSIYKGGYITIDCGGGDILTEEGITIPGVYGAISDSYGKIVILSNVEIGGEVFKYYILNNISSSATDYACSGVAINIYISNTNVIYAVANE